MYVGVDSRGAGRTVYVREHLSKGQNSREKPFARPGMSHGPAGSAGRRDGARGNTAVGPPPFATFDVSFLDAPRSLPPNANNRRLQSPANTNGVNGTTQWARPRHVWSEEARLSSRHPKAYEDMQKFEGNQDMLADMAASPLAGPPPRYAYHGFTCRERKNDLRRKNERVLGKADATFARIADVGRTRAVPSDWPVYGRSVSYMPGQEQQQHRRGIMAAAAKKGGGNNPYSIDEQYHMDRGEPAGSRGATLGQFTALDQKVGVAVPSRPVIGVAGSREDMMNNLPEELRDKLRVVPALGLDVANNWGAGAQMMQNNYR